MNGEEMEAAFWRILGVASKWQVRALRTAAEQFAESELDALTDGDAPAGLLSRERRQALRRRVVLYEESRAALVHYLITGARLACGAVNQDAVNTTERGRVSCGACKQTDAWKQAAA